MLLHWLHRTLHEDIQQVIDLCDTQSMAQRTRVRDMLMDGSQVMQELGTLAWNMHEMNMQHC